MTIDRDAIAMKAAEHRAAGDRLWAQGAPGPLGGSSDPVLRGLANSEYARAGALEALLS